MSRQHSSCAHSDADQTDAFAAGIRGPGRRLGDPGSGSKLAGELSQGSLAAATREWPDQRRGQAFAQRRLLRGVLDPDLGPVPGEHSEGVGDLGDSTPVRADVPLDYLGRGLSGDGLDLEGEQVVYILPGERQVGRHT